MEMTNSSLDFILLGFSLMGWAFSVHDKLKLKTAFIPIFVFSGITSLLFLSGLLNILPHTAILIFLFGIFLSIYYMFLMIRKDYSAKNFLTPSIAFFVFMSLILTVLLKGVYLIHYDNFSHWGLIVKEMFRIDGLPDDTTIIGFRNYPPGSAVFIYFVGKILGPGESHSLMAQGYLLSACLATLFVFSDWKKPISILLAIVGSITFFSIIPGNIFNLLVDTLLGVAAIAGFIISFYYKDDIKMSFIVNLPVLILIILIKDSGKIFFAFILLFTLISYSHNMRRLNIIEKKLTKENLYSITGLIFIPLFTDFLWRQYVKKAYPTVNYESNKFAISLERFSEINKTEEFIRNLAPKIVQSATDFSRRSFLVLFLVSILIITMILLLWLSTKKLNKVLFTSVILSTLYYVIYIFSLYIMYLYLMPEGEASYLAGFGRYQATIILFCIGIIFISFVYEYSRNNNKINKASILKTGFAILMILVLFVPMKNNIIKSFSKPETESAIRLKVNSAYYKIQQYGKDSPQVIYYSPDSKNDSGYLRYVLNYEQLNRKHKIVYKIETQEERNKVIDLLKEAEYIVVLKHDSSIQEFLSELSDSYGKSNVYKIVKDGEDIFLRPI